jgi:hypothetical protein
MSITQKYLLPLAVIGFSAFIATPSAPAWLKGEEVKAYCPGADRELKRSLWVNRSRDEAILTLTDRAAPTGHILIMDEATGFVINDLSRPKDAFTLPAGKRVGMLFVPMGKAIGLTLRIAMGGERVEFNLKKQFVSSILGSPLFNNQPGAFPPSSARINVYKSGFEDPGFAPFIECVD